MSGEPRLVPCACCDGEGTHFVPTGDRDWETGEPFGREEPCTICEGSGEVVAIAEPVEEADLWQDAPPC